MYPSLSILPKLLNFIWWRKRYSTDIYLAFTRYPSVIIMWKSEVTQWCGASNCIVSSSKTLVFCQQRIPQGHPSFLSRCISFASHSPSICYAFTRRRINNCIFYRLFLSAQALQESHRSLGKRGHCHEAVSIRTRTNYSLIVSLQVHCNDYGCIHSFWVIRVMTYKGH